MLLLLSFSAGASVSPGSPPSEASGAASSSSSSSPSWSSSWSPHRRRTSSSTTCRCHARRLLGQLEGQRAQGWLCDVIVVVHNALFRAHKNVLAASSAYLKALVLHDNLVTLDQEMLSPGLFRAVLDFIYTGSLPVPSSSHPSEAASLGALLAAASYLQIPDLVALCKKRLKSTAGTAPGAQVTPPSSVSSTAGLRGTTAPVIQGGFRREDPPGTLFVPPPPPPPPPPGLCSPLCGLDLSKKSPDGGPSPAPESRLRGALERPPSLGNHFQEDGAPLPLPPPPPPFPPSTALLSPAFHSLLQPPPHLLPENPRPELGPEFLYRWMKPEPLVGGYVGEEMMMMEEEEEEERRKRRKRLHREKEGGGGGGGEGERARSPPSPLLRRRRASEGGPGKRRSTTDEEEEEDGGGGGGGFGGYEGFGGDNLYVCIPCGKGFPSSEQLNAHVEAHNEEEEEEEAAPELSASPAPIVPPPVPPVPPVPPPAAPPVDLLLRPYRCSSCEKAYKDPATLRQHEKSHWLSRPYPCSICGKKFTQRGTMTRHMRSHLGLKPFACQACGMRFTRQYRLTEHLRIHSGEKPYHCHLCGGKFAQQRNLLSHMKMHAAAAAAAAAAASASALGPVEAALAQPQLQPQAQATAFLAESKAALRSLYLGLAPDKEAEGLPPPRSPPPPPPPGLLLGDPQRFSPP